MVEGSEQRRDLLNKGVVNSLSQLSLSISTLNSLSLNSLSQAEPGYQAEPTEPTELPGYQETQYKKLKDIINTSRSGEDGDRDLMAALVSEVLAFQVDPPATKKASKYGYFKCDLCKQINCCDSTFGGTLRHCGGVTQRLTHVTHWLETAAAATEKRSLAEIRLALPKTWGGERNKATTQYKAAAAKKQRTNAAADFVAQVTRAPAPAPPGRMHANNGTPVAVAAAAAGAAIAAAAAAASPPAAAL